MTLGIMKLKSSLFYCDCELCWWPSHSLRKRESQNGSLIWWSVTQLSLDFFFVASLLIRESSLKQKKGSSLFKTRKKRLKMGQPDLSKEKTAAIQSQNRVSLKK